MRQTEETKEKRRKSLLGKNKGKVHWESIQKAIAARGPHLSEEHKQKIRDVGAFSK